jgi:multicomponent Na+:H+ antiporter subunit G
MIEYAGYGLITLGIIFIFLAAVSIVRFPEFYSRLNALVKFSCFGTVLLLLGALVLCRISSISVKTIVCCIVILATLPVEAHVLINAARKSGIKLPGE